MSSARTQSLWGALFMLALLLIFPVDTVFALRALGDPVAYGKQDGIPGYVREHGDTLRVEVELEAGSDPQGSDVTFDANPPIEFTACDQLGTGNHLCYYEDELQGQGYPGEITLLPITVRNPSGADLELPVPSVKMDMTDPVILDFSVIDDTLVNDGTITINVSASASDEGVGIEHIEIRSGSPDGSLRETRAYTQDDEGGYPAKVDEEITLTLTDGDNDFWLVAYDAFGKTRTSGVLSLNVDGTMPVLGDIFIADCSSSMNEASVRESSIRLVPASGQEVCVYTTILDEAIAPDWEISASLIRFDQRSTQFASSTLLAEPDACLPSASGSLCKFSSYTTGRPIRISSPAGGSRSLQARVSVSDSWRNTREATLTADPIEFVDSTPEITGFGTPYIHEGTYYAKASSAEIILSYRDSVIPMPKESVIIDASDIGSGDAVAADGCTLSSCNWNISPASGAFSDGSVTLKDFSDTLGNAFNLEKIPTEYLRFDVVIDSDVPVIHSMELKNPSRTTGTVFKDCSDDGCASCDLDDASYGDCDQDTWDTRGTFFLEGDSLTVTALVNDSSPEVTATVDASRIVEDGEEITFTCTESAGSGHKCTYTFQDLAFQDSHFTMVLTDVAGHERRIRIPIQIYQDGGTGEVWSAVDHREEYQSPSELSKKWLTITDFKQTNVFQFQQSDSSDKELLNVVSRCEPGDKLYRGFVGDSTPDGHWAGKEYFMDIEYSGESNISRAEEIMVNCTFSTATLVDSRYVMTDETNVSFPVALLTDYTKTPQEQIDDEIESIKGKWQFFNNAIVPMLDMINTLKAICDIQIVTTGLVTGLAIVVDGLAALDVLLPGVGSAISAPVKLVKNAASWINDSIFRFLKLPCDFINCNLCRDSNNNIADTSICSYVRGVTDVGSYVTNPEQLMGKTIEKYAAGGGEKWNNAMDNFKDSGLYASSFDPASSLVTSLISLCLPGVFWNLEKSRQIDCKYIKCLQSVPETPTTVDDCKVARGYEKCEMVIGSFWQIMPFNNLIELYSGVWEDLLTDPANWFSYGGALLCFIPCGGAGNPGGLCAACEFMENLGILIETYGYLVEGMGTIFGGSQALAESMGLTSQCDGVMDQNSVSSMGWW